MSDSEIVKDFLQESYENLDRLDRELVGLGKNPRDTDALASVFRTITTRSRILADSWASTGSRRWRM
jgi:chemotaxis protein histidine kinase CheA